MSSNEEDDDDFLFTGGKKDAIEMQQSYLESVEAQGLSDKEKRQKLKMMMVNKRLDDLIEVLDQSVADL